jgi:hypothetical protein
VEEWREEWLAQQGEEWQEEWLAQQVGAWLALMFPEVISLRISEEALCKAIARIPWLNTGNHCHNQIQLEAIENKDEKEGIMMLLGIHSGHRSMSKNYSAHHLRTHIQRT